MIAINAIIQNFVMIFELIGLIIILNISANITKKTKRNILVTIILIIVTAVAYNLELWTQSFETLSVFRPLLTYCKYSLYPLIMVVLLNTNLQPNTDIKPLYKCLILIPEIIVIPFYFTSQYSHLVCYYTDDNHYQGGPLSYLPYIVFVFYLVLFIIQNAIALKRYSKSSRLISLYISIGAFIGVVLYLVFEVDVDYTPVFTSSLVLYFLFLYIHMSSIDSLTLLMNRQSYYQAITAGIEPIAAVVSIDMNDLKTLNDNYGHAEGDKALMTVSNIFLEFAGEKSRVYRIGGDEFIILYSKIDERDLQDRIRVMIDKLQETRYVCAFGYAMKKGRTNIEEVVRLADQRMYENKAKLKQQRF
ncbi:MAG: diguanylate cyclase [Bacilli bacterium]|nr:diguanylate cyclase [Bacilli bacterium]